MHAIWKYWRKLRMPRTSDFSFLYVLSGSFSGPTIFIPLDTASGQCCDMLDIVEVAWTVIADSAVVYAAKSKEG